MDDDKYAPRVLTTAEAMAEGPQDGVAYLVLSGLSPEEKAHAIAVATEVNRRLAEEAERGDS